METVVFIGWEEGLKKVSLTHLIKNECNLSFTQSKLIVDTLVKGVKVAVKCQNPTSLVQEAKLLGAIGEIKRDKLTYA